MMATSSTSNMMWLDYVIVIGVLVVSLLVGLYHAFTGGKQKTINEYLVANRNLKVLPTWMSLFISGTSSISVLGTVAEMYVYGSQIRVASIGNSFALLISALVFLPIVYPLKLISSLEYYTLRYNSNVLRKISVVSALSTTMMAFGLHLYALGTAFESVSGIPTWITMVTTAVLTITYTSMGGLLAVIWTDVVQGTTVLIGTAAVLIMAIVKVGGFSEIWRLCSDGERLIFFNMNPDPTIRQTFWTSLFGSSFGFTFTVITSQSYIQRLSSLQTQQKARYVMYMMVVSYWIRQSILCLLGLTVFAYYHKSGCDPLGSGKIQNSNQLLTYFIVDGLGYPGVTGIMIAVLFCASLSTLSTSLNGISAILWKEFFELRSRKLKEIHKALIAKVTVLVFGGVGIGMGFVLPHLAGHVMQIAQGVLSGLRSPVIGLLSLGILFRCANTKGALCGLVISFALTAWITIGQNIIKPHREYLETAVGNCSENATISEIPTNPVGVIWPYKVSYQYILVIGTFTTVIFGLAFSLIFGGQDPELDERTCLKCRCFGLQDRSKKGLNLKPKDDITDIKEIRVLSIKQRQTLAKMEPNQCVNDEDNNKLQSLSTDRY